MQLAISIFGGIAVLISTYLILFKKSKIEKDVVLAPYKIEAPAIISSPLIEPVIEVAVKTRKPRKPKASGSITPAVKQPKKVKSTPVQL